MMCPMNSLCVIFFVMYIGVADVDCFGNRIWFLIHSFFLIQVSIFFEDGNYYYI